MEFSKSTSQIQDTSLPSGTLSFKTKRIDLPFETVLKDSLKPVGFLERKIFIFLPSIFISSCLPKAGLKFLSALSIKARFTLKVFAAKTAARVFSLLYVPKRGE